MELSSEEKQLATPNQVTLDEKTEKAKELDMEFVAPDDNDEPVEHAREEKKPKRSTIVLQSNTKGRRLKRVMKCLPLSRRELEEL